MAKLRILSIDGGGTRGMIPATILALLQRDTGKHPTELFDVFTGTSTGGIIVAGLAAGVNPSVMADIYTEKSSFIFGGGGFRETFNLFRSKHTNENLRTALTEVLGDLTMGDIHAKYNNLNEAPQKVFMINAFDLAPMQNFLRLNTKTGIEEIVAEPVNFRPTVFNSCFQRDQKLKMVDVALRSSAGPSYLPIHQMHTDGGVGMNHPAMSAVAFAINKNKANMIDTDARRTDTAMKGLGYDMQDLHVLSLGTGTSNSSYLKDLDVADGDKGSLFWATRIADILTESNMQVSEYYVRQVLDKDQYMRIQFNFNDPKAPSEIRGRDILLDETNPLILNGLKKYAEQYYEEKRATILSFVRNV